ncbi:Bax inhibitor-1/YccA family protein [Niameybacter massiliensis]|uniref:Bax inhibitor-1/YccA family protein n=1 Tax=Holtiella tumoricola TaxID=3018743 RepID=A0AA42DQ98_9FIRM|nr:Bax inhibitor-1/YccA family protein [Holtiella tumoricola]MDA3732926.1 Bax inhibitor-1/YccA family protein [Holtiella tumoricola]
MENNQYSSIRQSSSYNYINKAYLWMFVGLLCTALTSYVMIATDLIWVVYSFSWLPFAMIIAKIALVIFLSSRIYKMQTSTARMVFIGYSILTGITFSVIFFMFDITSVFIAFAFAAILFACLSIIGFTTEKDFSSIGNLCFMGLFILLGIGVVGFFINLSGYDLLIGLFGVIVFLGLTIYDTQKMKNTFGAVEQQSEMMEKVAIYFALELYLDFINIFIYLVRMMGKRN